jgi:hypothetical protein
MQTLTFSAPSLEQKRIARVAEANQRLEQKLAQRLRLAEVCQGIPLSTSQENFAHPALAGEQASKSADAVALEAVAASAQGDFPAIQFAQTGLLP